MDQILHSQIVTILQSCPLSSPDLLLSSVSLHLSSFLSFVHVCSHSLLSLPSPILLLLSCRHLFTILMQVSLDTWLEETVSSP